MTARVPRMGLYLLLAAAAIGCEDGTLRVWRVDVGAACEAVPAVRQADQD